MTTSNVTFNEAASALKVGEKYTIFTYGAIGMPIVSHITLVSAEVGRYAQYPESLLLMFKLPRKRNVRGMRINPNEAIIIWRGHLPVNDEIYVSENTTCNGIVCHRSLGSFDQEYMTRALDSVRDVPIYQYGSGIEREGDERRIARA